MIDVDVTAPTVRDGAAPPAKDAEIPPRLGRYVILERLGAGGMGVVYAAYDPSLDRKVAVKVLHDHGGARTQVQERLLREARSLAKMSHRNVVAVHDVGVAADRVFLAMELVDGASLRAWLDEKPRTRHEILDAFVAAGRGLAAAHRAGVVHRDFKPENVLVARDGRVVVGDFGLARFEDEPSAGARAASPQVTVTGARMGTPAYMAPEQHRGDRTDERTDQFSFCVALYEALHGERPFTPAEGDLPPGDALALAVVGGRVRPAPAKSDVPARLRKLLLRGLAVDPAARHPSMDALVDELADDPTARRLRWLAVGALVVATAGGVAFVVPRGGSQAALVCRGAERKLDGTWDTARKAGLRAAVLASKKPGAELIWRALETTLDGWTSRWVAAHTEACEATELRREQSSEVRDLRMACLDDLLVRVRALTGELAASGDAVLDQGLGATARLPSVEACAETATLMEQPPLPAAPDARAEIAALRDLHARADALQALSKHADAAPLVADGVARARKLGYAPMDAAMTLVDARVRYGRADHAGAIEAYRHAARMADVARDDALRADALAGLVWAVGDAESKYHEAHELTAVARAALSRVGPRPELEAHLLAQEAKIYELERKYADAERLFLRALELRERHQVDRRMIATVLGDLATVYMAQEKHDEARKTFDRALKLTEEVVGRRHPEYAYVLSNSAELDLIARDHDRVLAVTRQAVEIFAGWFGADSIQVANARSNAAILHYRAGDLAAALGEFEAAATVTERVFGPEHPATARAITNVAQTLLELGRPRDAIAPAERAAAIFAKADRSNTTPGRAEWVLATALWDANQDRPRARKLMEETHARMLTIPDAKHDLPTVAEWLKEHR